MNQDQREDLKAFFMIGAPVMLVVGAVLPSILILPLAITMYLGTIMVAYLLGDINQEQEKWKTKVIVFSIFIISIAWIGVGIKILTN